MARSEFALNQRDAERANVLIREVLTEDENHTSALLFYGEHPPAVRLSPSLPFAVPSESLPPFAAGSRSRSTSLPRLMEVFAHRLGNDRPPDGRLPPRGADSR